MSREISAKTRRLFKRGAADLRRQKREQAAGRERIVLAAEMLAAEWHAWVQAGSLRDREPILTPLQYDTFWNGGWDHHMDGLDEPETAEGLAGWLYRDMVVSGEEQAE